MHDRQVLTRDVHRHLADHLAQSPGALELVVHEIRRYKAIVSGEALACIERWEAIVAAGLPEVLLTLQSDSADADELRDFSPFWVLLPSTDRFAFYRRWLDEQRSAT